MTLPLTPDTLRALYDFLNETPPFKRWNLPDGEDVEFRVVRDHSRYAYHELDGEKNTITFSSLNIGHTSTLLRVMAHEMVHVYERRSKSGATGHSRAFLRWGAQVCKYHGFDPKEF
jgi:SprT-like family